jgi:hypothetical protein
MLRVIMRLFYTIYAESDQPKLDKQCRHEKSSAHKQIVLTPDSLPLRHALNLGKSPSATRPKEFTAASHRFLTLFANITAFA